jgi:hypothetical protein
VALTAAVVALSLRAGLRRLEQLRD